MNTRKIQESEKFPTSLFVYAHLSLVFGPAVARALLVLLFTVTKGVTQFIHDPKMQTSGKIRQMRRGFIFVKIWQGGSSERRRFHLPRKEIPSLQLSSACPRNERTRIAENKEWCARTTQ